MRDEFLHNALKQEKQHDLGELYRWYYPKVYQTCYSYTKNQDDAFDLAHDIMLKVFHNINAFQGNSSFSTWLYSITRNHCLSTISKKKMLYCEEVHAAHHLIAQEFSSEELGYVRYSGTFTNETLAQVLDLMKLATPIDYTIYPREKNPDGTYSLPRVLIGLRKGYKLSIYQ